MSPYLGSQKREGEGRGALRLSDLVMSGVTASLAGWEVERGRSEREGRHLLLAHTETSRQGLQNQIYWSSTNRN